MLPSPRNTLFKCPSWAARLIAISFSLSASVHAADAPRTTGESPPITSVTAIHLTRAWDLHNPKAMTLEGTITFVAPDRRLLILQDGESAAAIHSRADLVGLQAGDRVRVESSAIYPQVPSVPGFPFQPGTSDYIDRFELDGDDRPNYVDRLQGYVTPPADGEYRFWISSDDSSELWLSDDDSRMNARRIANVPAYTVKYEWTRFPSQHSKPIRLQAGQRYYMEVLHEQYAGADHIAVAWERADLPREVIAGRYLHPYQSVVANRNSGSETADRTPSNGILRQVWAGSAIRSLDDLRPARAAATLIEAEDLTVVKLGHASMPPPIQINVGQPFSSGDNFRWAEMVAEIRAVKRVGDGWDLELFEGDSRMVGHVQDWSGAIPSQFRGYLVRLAGACEGAFDAQGRTIPGSFWIHQLGNLTIAGTAPTWDKVPPSHLSELERMEIGAGDDVPVRIRGRVVAQTSPQNLVLEDEGSFSAYSSSDGRDWKMLGDEVHTPMRDPVLVGLAVTSHGPQNTIARFDHVTGLDGDMQSDEVGTKSQSSSFTVENGTFSITGSGYDIWNWQDDFFFVHKSLTGDGEFVARVDSLSMHDPWAKAGLMIRESLAPDAPFVDLVNVGGSRFSLQWRQTRPHRATAGVYSPENENRSWLKLVRRHHSLPFSTRQETVVSPGELVDGFGYLRRTAGGVAISDGFIRPVESSDQSRSEDDQPLIEIRSLSTWSPSSIPNHYRLRGVVTCNRSSNGRHYFAMQDATGGAFVVLNNIADQQILQPGTLVDAYVDPIVMGNLVTKVITVGPATMPKPIVHPMELLDPSKGDGQWIEAEGIVYSVYNHGAILRAAGSYLEIEATGMSTGDWARLVDRRVRVQGVALDQHTSELKVLVPSASYVEELGYDMAGSPSSALSIAELITSRNRPDPSHRVRVVGTITFRYHQFAIVDDGTGTSSVQLRGEEDLIQVGEKAEVIGFPTTKNDGALTLLFSTARSLGPGVVPAAIQSTASAALDGSHGQRLVTFEAEVVGQIASEAGALFDLQSDGRKFRVWCPTRSATLTSIPDGSRIRLTGFAKQGPLFASADPLFTNSRERTIQFIARSPEDIAYLQGPPWMRLKQALYVLAGLAGVLVAVVAWAQVLRRRVKQRTEQLNATLAELRKETELAATLTERERLAGEIHDSLEQGISGVMLQLEGALQSPTCPADIRDLLSVARNMVAFSHAEIRHAIWALYSPVLNGKNLHGALQQMTHLVGGRSPAVEVALIGTPVALSSELEHHLLRIAQETVTNAVKHANASKIEVELEFKADTVELRVKDDGCGFSTENHSVDNTHFGLRSLRRRAKTMNGRLAINSSPQGGTVIEVVVPLSCEIIT